MGSAARLAVLACTASIAAVACGDSEDPPARTPVKAPDITLTADEKRAWAPLPPDRSAIPVLLYHGIGPESDFSNADDAAYGVATDDFAKQMTMIAHAGYETIDLEGFAAYMRAQSKVANTEHGDANQQQWKVGDRFVFGADDDPPPERDQPVNKEI